MFLTGLPVEQWHPRRRFPLIVVSLLLLCVMMFAVEMGSSDPNALIRQLGLVPRSALSGSLLPWFSHMFLHGGLWHLLGNLYFLWIFGDNVEDRMGPLRFVGFYLLCAVLAALAELMLQPNSPAPMIGASGAIAGVMGAYLVMYPRARIILLVPLLFWPLFFTVPALVFLGYWFVIQVLSGGLGLAANTAEPGGIAFGAHVGGFIAGVALHPLFVRRTPRRRQSDERSLESAWQPRGLS
jgi:membrane associated rhomboid family serine protease